MITEELLNKCKRGDEKSQYQLYRYCFDLLMPICMRYKTNENDAIASLNLAYLKLIKKAGSRKHGIEFVPWAKRLMINLLIDEYRQNKRRRNTLLSTDPQEIRLNGTMPDFNTAALEMDADQIIYYIQKLGEPGRTIFNLHAIEGYSHKEIAERLAITPENCRYHLHTARKTLQHQLNNHIKQSKDISWKTI